MLMSLINNQAIIKGGSPVISTTFIRWMFIGFGL